MWQLDFGGFILWYPHGCAVWIRMQVQCPYIAFLDWLGKLVLFYLGKSCGVSPLHDGERRLNPIDNEGHVYAG